MNIVRYRVASVLMVFVLLASGTGSVVFAAKIKFYEYANGAAVGGYDVVAYFDSAEAVPGEKVYAANYAEQLWLFKSMENREKFLAEPERYFPQYGGHCAYGLASGYLVRGDPEAWTVHSGKLYLNYSKGVRKNWLVDVDGFIVRSEKNWLELNK